MIINREKLLAIAKDAFGTDIPKSFLILDSLDRLDRGEKIQNVARDVHTTRKRLETIAAATDPIEEIFKIKLSQAASAEYLRKARRQIGQLTLGLLAERAFETVYNEKMRARGLHLEDARESRNETDYRVFNGQNRPMFRINIKFYGSPFRKAEDLVGLQSEDCFALATYKIHQALQKQEEEHIPYVFVIVGVPDLTGEKVGDAISGDLAHLAAFVQNGKVERKRAAEERIVDHLLEKEHDMVSEFSTQIRDADWFVLSARKADNLLKEKLFERVYAVRVRAFAQNYRGAEVDMHLSVKEDLTRLEDFLESLEKDGAVGLTSRLERGTF